MSPLVEPERAVAPDAPGWRYRLQERAKCADKWWVTTDSHPRVRAVVSIVAAVALGAPVLLSPEVSYLLRTVTALAAAIVLATGSRRSPLGLSRRLLCGALLIGACSGVVAALHLVVTGSPAPVGWIHDWLYLGYAPVAVAGVMAVPRTSGSRGDGVRALADGAVAASALWFVTVVLVVEPLRLGYDLPPAQRVVTLGYTLLPAFVVAVILSVLPRATRSARPFLFRAAVGVSALGLSDIAYSVASAQHRYHPDSWIAMCNQVGLVLLLDAALVAVAADRRSGTARPADADRSPLMVALMSFVPYAPMFVALVVVLVEFTQGHGIPYAAVPPILLCGGAVTVRHVSSAQYMAGLVQRLSSGERAAREAARRDALTGLLNRSAFVERLDLALGDRALHPVGVALLDLNDFKDVNDTHGHGLGDAVLVGCAQRLVALSLPVTVSRLGGDEFALFAPRCADGGVAFAEAISAAFGAPLQLGSRSFEVRPSVGVVVDERPAGRAREGDASHLLAHADVAMYRAKSTKSTQPIPVAVLTGAERAEAAATIRIREEISTPDLSQFFVVYQPIVDLATGAVAGAEALLRWKHPKLGPIPPATFVPLAEDVGSVSTLGLHVLRTALDDLAAWSRLGADVHVGVNVSPRQLSDLSLPSHVLAELEQRGLSPQQLTLEVTEEALVRDLDTAVSTVGRLRAAGVSVAVDDFGTGYSSLRYLRRFQADTVKIDREFVQACPDEPRTDALVRSVVEMANALDVRCVAEGIETLEQLRAVRAHGCQLGQGFLLARPMPADAIAALLRAGHVYPVSVEAPPSAAPSGGDAARVVPLRRTTR